MADVTELAEGLHCIDLRFQGMPGIIASYLLEDAGERVLIETGPASTIDSLLAGLDALGVESESISKLLVTHIHLDHAGAAGTLIARFPNARLYVHENGAPHMIDPAKLLASASRIYGDMMGPLWGETIPVPKSQVAAIADGDRVTVGNRALDVVYTPGHASHHVIYHDAGRRCVFAGDAAAVRLQGFDYIIPPTPPPDIDLRLWGESLDHIAALDARAIYLAHFGAYGDVEEHLRRTRRQLFVWADLVERALRSGQDRPAIVDNLMQHATRDLLAHTNDARVLESYELAAPYGMSVDGLLRYFRKRAPTG